MQQISDNLVYQLHIKILGSNPEIWRRVIVPVNFSFAMLHSIIQSSFSWENEHLHMFVLPIVAEDGQEDRLHFEPQNEYGENVFMGSLDEEEHYIKDYLNVGDQFRYDYDFGDDWQHQILVEGLLIKQKKQKYPVCVDGENHAPFEDIGGVPGFTQAIKILAEPTHPEHKELKSWLKASYGAVKINKFDPTYFDPKKLKLHR